MPQDFVVAIDQGTTSTRAVVFNHNGRIVASGQTEHRQFFPQAGWVEHDPIEIWDNTRQVIGMALAAANITRHDVAAIGITNQRETTVVWDRRTGQPVYNAIVWQDVRSQPICDQLAADGGVERFRDTVGLPLNPYFAGTKLVWILDNVPGARQRGERGDLLFGTTDSWVLWNLTGGPRGGVHATDVTNASRTLFMDLRTLQWDQAILDAFGVPRAMLPKITSSSEVVALAASDSLLRHTPVAGVLGDQQAATFGQTAFERGQAKNTYGTGCFLIFNTGTDLVLSNNGLLTTVAYRLGQDQPVYALEGSIAVAGSLIQWLRDNLKLIDSAAQAEPLASSVADNGGAYVVPAFSGLFAPYWRTDARGAIVGLTRYVNRGHLVRAALEATAYQTCDVLRAVNADSGVPLSELRVDGGMVTNELLMQFQADLLGVPVVRPVVAETTALGAAYAAGLATGFWDSLADLRANWAEDRRWEPTMEPAQRERLSAQWAKAVTKTYGWTENADPAPGI